MLVDEIVVDRFISVNSRQLRLHTVVGDFINIMKMIWQFLFVSMFLCINAMLSESLM